uniref:Uncharacterized protein n=1 Tax=Ditylenchus dipsaci TaxID=166011 RepID=A0A915ENX0_9BILA
MKIRTEGSVAAKKVISFWLICYSQRCSLRIMARFLHISNKEYQEVFDSIVKIDDKRFYKEYRLTKQGVTNLANNLADDLEYSESSRGRKSSPTLQVCVAVAFLRSPGFQWRLVGCITFIKLRCAGLWRGLPLSCLDVQMNLFDSPKHSQPLILTQLQNKDTMKLSQEPEFMLRMSLECGSAAITHGELQNDITLIPKLTVTAACLWNFFIDQGYDVERDDQEEDQSQGNHDDDGQEVVVDQQVTGREKRDHIVQQYFT